MDKENQLTEALEAAIDKKAQDIVVIELKEICSFTDDFIICTGTSAKQYLFLQTQPKNSASWEFGPFTSRAKPKATGFSSTMSIS